MPIWLCITCYKIAHRNLHLICWEGPSACLRCFEVQALYEMHCAASSLFPRYFDVVTVCRSAANGPVQRN